MAGQWDPYAVLNINKTRSRCYGWAPSKGRLCENPISVLNRNKAHHLMSRIARLSPSDEKVMGLLSRVARCLMCQNNHQGQATSVLDRWEQKIETITESSVVEDDEEEDEEEERIENEESIPRADQRTQMSEIHEILRRIEAALVANQRRVEISASAGSSQIDSDSRPEVAPSGTGDDSNEAGSVRQTTEESFLAAVSLPKTDNLAPDHGYDDRSSDTVIEDTLLTLGLERTDLGPSSSEGESDASTAIVYAPPKDDISERRHDIFGHGFRLPNATLRAIWNTNPLWLTILIVYIGAVKLWHHLLGPNQTYLPYLGLPESGSRDKDTATEPLRLDGPSLQSLEMLKCY